MLYQVDVGKRDLEKATLMQRMLGWVSRRDRQPASFAGSVLLGDGSTIDVMVTDRSVEGCQISSAHNLPIGETVTLECASHSLKASVRWALLGRAGLRFCTDE